MTTPTARERAVLEDVAWRHAGHDLRLQPGLDLVCVRDGATLIGDLASLAATPNIEDTPEPGTCRCELTATGAGADRDCRIHGEAASPATGEAHPEDACQRCGRPNPAWSAPNDLWNAVMGGEGGIVCPSCFAAAADPSIVWRFSPATGEGLDAWQRRAEYAESELARICTCPHGTAGNRTETDPRCPVHLAEARLATTPDTAKPRNEAGFSEWACPNCAVVLPASESHWNVADEAYECSR